MAETKTSHSDESTDLRRLAEERLKENREITRPSGAVEDQLRLLHELQVYNTPGFSDRRLSLVSS